VRAALVLLAACNQVYDLQPTVARDARFFDAPSDAPFSCPLDAPLAFSSKLAQLPLDCAYYTASASKNRGLAACRINDIQVISIGPVDGPFASLGLPPESSEIELSQPRLAADGELFLLHTYDIGNVVGRVRVYRDIGGTWVRGTDLPGDNIRTTNPSRGPDRRILVHATATELRELREDGSGAWLPVRTHSLAQIGVPNLTVLWLAPDARRLLFAVNAAGPPEIAFLAFTVRSSVDDLFGPMVRTELPLIIDPFITDDCSRIYFSGLRSLFYAQQL
jgi:hypothetical protein